MLDLDELNISELDQILSSRPTGGGGRVSAITIARVKSECPCDWL